MKTFSGIKTVEAIKAQCDERGWKIDTTKFDRGDDFITFHFEHEGTAATVVHSGFNGRFTGQTGEGLRFSSDDTQLDGTPWFDALLGFVYVSTPATEAA